MHPPLHKYLLYHTNGLRPDLTIDKRVIQLPNWSRNTNRKSFRRCPSSWHWCTWIRRKRISPHWCLLGRKKMVLILLRLWGTEPCLLLWLHKAMCGQMDPWEAQTPPTRQVVVSISTCARGFITSSVSGFTHYSLNMTKVRSDTPQEWGGALSHPIGFQA